LLKRKLLQFQKLNLFIHLNDANPSNPTIQNNYNDNYNYNYNEKAKAINFNIYDDNDIALEIEKKRDEAKKIKITKLNIRNFNENNNDLNIYNNINMIDIDNYNDNYNNNINDIDIYNYNSNEINEINMDLEIKINEILKKKETESIPSFFDLNFNTNISTLTSIYSITERFNRISRTLSLTQKILLCSGFIASELDIKYDDKILRTCKRTKIRKKQVRKKFNL
jgi:hypothetical protein